MKARSPSFLAVCLAILATALIISAVLVEPAQGLRQLPSPPSPQGNLHHHNHG
ncbi:hypothetical protein SETIT_5G077100v2 [Setaria italica]|uniref:Uncharacterized protein n=2 Tax=Setaria TaxID=4554 RepID=A0A368R462_SETIT|nr:hypothetical protein SETIT_J031000v2 [Setaria italica]RCV24340.1 hypothetical protein SETIT_5G077100v2 [Setaria italica]TKW13061.1 hypothetical protein SEVIR_5G075800v2 [Setaria viridis]